MMDLEKLNRTDLQKLAKINGLKANQKNKKLIIQLKKILENKTSDEETITQDSKKMNNSSSSDEQTTTDMLTEEADENIEVSASIVATEENIVLQSTPVKENQNGCKLLSFV